MSAWTTANMPYQQQPDNLQHRIFYKLFNFTK